jgi:hypothetical protein
MTESLCVKNVITFEEVNGKILNIIPKGESCEINFRSTPNFCYYIFTRRF